MNIRSRIVGTRKVRASELRPHPLNWRTHPTKQRDALQAMLAKHGWTARPRVRVCDDGSLQLLDGHLRAEIMGDDELEVDVLDLTEKEGNELLATFDALAMVAGKDDAKAAELLASVSIESSAVADLLAKTTGKGILDALDVSAPPVPPTIAPRFEVLVTLPDEHAQAELLEELTGRGLTVKSLIA